MLATTTGMHFGVNADWDEKEQNFKIPGRIVKTSSATQSAVGEKNVWTSTIACSVPVP
jgi:arginine decarboxylase